MAESSMKDINLRIKSIKSTKQITKAMELVASSKLTKAKEKIEKSRLFHSLVYKEMAEIVARNLDSNSIYMLNREVKKSAYVVIAGDRGLAGGYNSNIFNFTNGLVGNKSICILPIGKRSADYYKKRNYEIITTEFQAVEEINVGSCHEISNLLANCYGKGEFDELFIIYTNFISVLNQQPEVMKILPLNKELHKDIEVKREFILFEPNSSFVFDAIVPSFIASMLWGAVCESMASEFGARRTAMESATKNAQEMIDNLSLKYNRARQSSITQEITEIVAGSGV